MRHAGIDEAGYGPLLGPLAVVAVAAEAETHDDLADGLRAGGVRDSKRVHTPGDIGGIDAVALPGLAWASGTLPATAAQVFDLLGEDAGARAGVPWMAAADTLPVPLAAPVSPWRLPRVRPCGVWGRLIQPRAWNIATRAGTNKAALELAAVLDLLDAAHPGLCDQITVVDRLGGRKFYRQPLQARWPGRMVLVDDESPASSRYRVLGPAAEHQVGFWVGGEERSPLTALASCVAKYARELHMHLLNAWWSARHPGLTATAGYPQDAGRWLTAIGGDREAFSDFLVRLNVADAATNKLSI
jgi:ribonuclease HII